MSAGAATVAHLRRWTEKMKHTLLLLGGTLLLVFACCAANAQTQGAPFSRGGPDPEAQRVDAKITKVISVTDDHARYRAYLVRWKEQEVAIVDSRANTLHKEGDTISVWARKRKVSENEQVLEFSLTQPYVPYRRTETK